MNALRYVLLALAVYMTIVGVLFLFAPRTAEAAFNTRLPDAALTPLYGQLVLVIALTSFLVSTNVTAYRKLVWALIFTEAGHILVFGYELATGIATFAQVGPPMIVAAVFLVLMLAFYNKR